MPSPLGDKIRALRKQKKLSLEQLAELTDSSKSYIWELENKDDPKPSADKIGKIAWKPLFFIILANLVFGACIGGLPLIGLKPLGLIVGIYLLTFIASQAGEEFAFKPVLILASLLAGPFLLLLISSGGKWTATRPTP